VEQCVTFVSLGDHVLDITCDGKLAECLFLLTLGTSRLEAFVAVAVAVSVSVCRRKDV
jgi:hypothetical protein